MDGNNGGDVTEGTFFFFISVLLDSFSLFLGPFHVSSSLSSSLSLWRCWLTRPSVSKLSFGIPLLLPSPPIVSPPSLLLGNKGPHSHSLDNLP